ncbi:MAG TPA: ATP synthase subunit I [Stellaceae bacterium]|nr:ATP synthase subunit I [Stellaceae bacterium]
MAVAGVAFGLIYFAVLRRTSVLLAAGGGWTAPLAFTAARICGAVIFLTLAAELGAASLLAAFIGFLVARAIAVRVVRRAS